MLARQMMIWVGDDEWLVQQQRQLSLPEQHCLLDHQHIHQAKNLLGQEFQLIIYDARQQFNLDALAIAAGTLCAGGTLIMLFNHWHDLAQQPDWDSLRWAGTSQPICTPNFIRFFQQKVQQHGIPVYQQGQSVGVLPPAAYSPPSQQQATLDQQQIIQQILATSAQISIITAKRGRGKSALAGLLANALTQSGKPRLIVTAPNKRAVAILQVFSQQANLFMAPDALYEQIQQNPHQFADDWLFIDEAAALPIELLNGLISSFQHIVCTTTVQSYEGTGRGFLLKFMANLTRPVQHFTLHKPLRWAEHDPLECFVDDLLLADAEEFLLSAQHEPLSNVTLAPITGQIGQETLAPLYGLLTLAHYRTSPLDLRRLLDAPNQHFYYAKQNNKLLGAVWLLVEGGMDNPLLIDDICRGTRRPKGNLVAQSLAMHGMLPAACALRSWRISRIAVLPDYQQQGIGKQLIADICQQATVDFLSVSFGYTPQLAQFWQQNGFHLMHLGEHKEASSGCYSAIVVYPISAAGQKFTEQMCEYFQRYLPLSFHPLRTAFPMAEDWTLNEQDWQSLKNFAFGDRSLGASLPAIRRLLHHLPMDCCPLLRAYCADPDRDKTPWGGKKAWLVQCRLEIQQQWETQDGQK